MKMNDGSRPIPPERRDAAGRSDFGHPWALPEKTRASEHGTYKEVAYRETRAADRATVAADFDPRKPNGGVALVDVKRGTQELYQRDGLYPADRVALHQRIKDDMSAGVPASVGSPKLVLLAGGSASGKSHAKPGFIRSNILPDTGHAVHTDADDVKLRLPEYNMIGESRVDDAIESRAVFVHEESSDVHKELVAESLAAGRNVVADETGDGGYPRLVEKVRLARKNGAGQVECHFLSYPTDDAWKRAQARAKLTGRDVPESAVRETHASAARNAKRAIDEGLFDYIVLWDNDVPDGAPPRKIAERRLPEERFVFDPEALKKVEAKAREWRDA